MKISFIWRIAVVMAPLLRTADLRKPGGYVVLSVPNILAKNQNS